MPYESGAMGKGVVQEVHTQVGCSPVEYNLKPTTATSKVKKQKVKAIPGLEPGFREINTCQNPE
jgi:hypothetical protein